MADQSITIAQLIAREILDSRGIPTIEVTIFLSNQAMVVASVSTINETDNRDLVESRDTNDSRMGGVGVKKAVDLINTVISPKIVGLNPVEQEKIDAILTDLDGSENASKIGGNTMMAVSQAVIKAAAMSYGWPLYYYLWRRYQLIPRLKIPTPIVAMFNGGSLGNDNINFAEVQIIPFQGIPYPKALEMAVATFNNLYLNLNSKGAGQATSSLGGFIPVLYKNTDAFDLLVEVIRTSGFVMGSDLFFGLDCSADHFYNMGKYKIKDISTGLNTASMADFLTKLNSTYGVYMYEDPFTTDDIAGWKKFNFEIGDRVKIVSDHLTNGKKSKIEKAINDKLCNTFLIKPDQTKTITEMLKIIQVVKNSGMQFTISQREGETNDSLLADMAVGLGADFCKFGAPNRGERIAKYNRLLQISDEVTQLNIQLDSQQEQQAQQAQQASAQQQQSTENQAVAGNLSQPQ